MTVSPVDAKSIAPCFHHAGAGDYLAGRSCDRADTNDARSAGMLGGGLRLIADDLTGAADAGVAFSRSGAPTTLLLDTLDSEWTCPLPARDGGSGRFAIAVDAATRDGCPATARAVVRHLARPIGHGDVLFKKIDSLLRGHVGVELKCLRECFPDRLIVLAPAFPALARSTRGGVQYVTGAPLHWTTAWAAEPTAPPRSLAELVRGLPATTLGLSRIRIHESQLADRFRAIGEEGRVVICDAETDADLDAIVHAGVGCGRPVVWVGAGGLAQALARAVVERSDTTLELPAIMGPFLVVIGSASDSARAQGRALEAAGATRIEVRADLLARGDIARVAAAISKAAAHGDTVVSVVGDVNPSSRETILAGLATATATAAATARLLVLTGGGTARAVLRARGVLVIELLGPLEPGVVLARSRDEPGTAVVTKGGTIGDDHVLVRAVARARSEHHS